jgi:hypothetical protein
MNLSVLRRAANSAGTAVFAVEVRIMDYLGINSSSFLCPITCHVSPCVSSRIRLPKESGSFSTRSGGLFRRTLGRASSECFRSWFLRSKREGEKCGNGLPVLEEKHSLNPRIATGLHLFRPVAAAKRRQSFDTANVAGTIYTYVDLMSVSV